MNRCVGVVLSVLDLNESDRIATVFSPSGLIKFFVKRNRGSLLTILTEGEFVYVAGKSDLHHFRDGTILNQNIRLRERLENMEAAGYLVRALLKSQFPGKTAPHLYQLFCYLLQMIPQVESPSELAAIFLIKTLVHEGLFQKSLHCTVCQKPPLARFGGERFCLEHAPEGALEISSADEGYLATIVEGRSLNNLLTNKIELISIANTLFNQSFEH